MVLLFVGCCIAVVPEDQLKFKSPRFVKMKLLPREIDKLVLSQAGSVAQKRLARGILLNQTEVTALIACVLLEHVRDGKLSLGDLQSLGKELIGKRMVMPQARNLDHVSVEGTFPDGTKLITVHDPVCTLNGDLQKALYGSMLQVPDISIFPPVFDGVEPGQLVLKQNAMIVLNQGRKRIKLHVWNNGDRPIQVGSHYHFCETNFSLLFDRIKAYGYRLDIAAGTSVRFEPGEKKVVQMVEIGGHRIISGGNSLATGPITNDNLEIFRGKLMELGVSCYNQMEEGKYI